MWELYDDLINGIPEDIMVEEAVNGCYFSMVKSTLGVGLGSSMLPLNRLPTLTKPIIGMSLKRVASCVKSWNFLEAAMGLAAINSYYNAIPVAKGNGVEIRESIMFDDRVNDPFVGYQKKIEGKNVAVVGHFPLLEDLFEPICQLSIIERDPIVNDYPDAASEYILPLMDYVFITGSSLVNKTLPRLLQLSNSAYVIVVGPSTTLAPKLFDYGVNELAGFVVTDQDRCKRVCEGSERVKLYRSGQKVEFIKKYVNMEGCQ
ncbi:Rossmann-like domain-containing protein [Anaerosporobacter sp.]